MVQVGLEEAQANLPTLVEAALHSEAVVIVKTPTEVVRLVADHLPSEPPPEARRLGSAKGMIWMSDDFDAPLEDFEPYMR